jgi:[glutamine synthetase] adenylyltransferase / [glutamine synthetase]-adenylyl-L-tyrosine phosphorylase
MLPPRTSLPWPAPADPAAADRFVERLAEIAGDQGLPPGMLRAIGGNSDYLAGLALREPQTLRRFAEEGAEAEAARAFLTLAEARADWPQAKLAQAMRVAKRQVALITGLADITGVWPLSRVTGTLSKLAEETLTLGVRHLILAAHGREILRLPAPETDPDKGSGLTVLALGKLGGRELNYSSDIDLIVFYDPAAVDFGGDSHGAFYTRLARDLVKLMEARDADGYVFRVDLRLRPDPAAMPLAVSVPTALTYYETLGRNWERAALLKARPVAGDRGLGAEMVEALRPFVWRRHLDFAAIADIHAMKRRMDAHRGRPIPTGEDAVSRLLGHDLKLGRGGIREIEFLAQTLQLVWGGREPILRIGATLPALRLLARLGHLPSADAARLTRAYRFLRQAEHRLQMVDDRQTHKLPGTHAEFAAFATFLGYPTADAFAHAALEHLDGVQLLFDSFFETDEGDENEETLELGAVDQPIPAKIVEWLKSAGFQDPPHIITAVRLWQAGRPRALRSERARALLEPLLPRILAALGGQPQPDHAFSRFDAFITRLPAGIQLLSLFQRNPALIDRIAALLGAAPGLADHLAIHPGALEGLLGLEEVRIEPARMLGRQLADATTLEDTIALTRHFVSEESFRIGVATLEGRMDVDAAGLARAALADAALEALLAGVLAQHDSRYGQLEGGAVVVVLLGKGGGREMMPGSDLDLMLIYDMAEDAGESQGPRPLAPSQWFARLATAFTGALTAQGVEGPMFRVDMRLRPSGSHGPVAVSLASFERYHAADAWTWEQMSLIRARVVAGPEALRARVEAAIAQALLPRRTPATLRENARAMRARMLRDLPQEGPWDVRLRPGGMIEVEFLAQVLQLAYFGWLPERRSTTTRIALRHLEEDGHLSPEDAAVLIEADHLWRTIQSSLRLTVGRPTTVELPEAPARVLLAAVAETTVPNLRATMDRVAAAVHERFVRLIGDPQPGETPRKAPPAKGVPE